MGVCCDCFLLIYLQIMIINAITLPLTTTSKSIPVKPQSTSSSGISLGDCSTLSPESTPPLRENLSKSLNPFLLLPELPTKVSDPSDVSITALNLNVERLTDAAVQPFSDNICTPNNLDSCMSSSNILNNVVVPSKKGFTACLKLTPTTSERPTSVLIKPSLHCGTQNVDSLVLSPKCACGSGLSPEVVDSPSLLPLWNINPTLSAVPYKSTQQSISSTSPPNFVYNNSPSSFKVTNSPNITTALLNLSPISTSYSPKSETPLVRETQNVDATLSLPNIVSYFFPSLPKVTALPGSTLSSFNLNPMPPTESPNCSAIKPNENNYLPNNIDSFTLAPFPPRLVSSTVNPLCHSPKSCVVLQNNDKVVSPNTISNNYLLPNALNPPKVSSPSNNLSELNTYSPRISDTCAIVSNMVPPTSSPSYSLSENFTNLDPVLKTINPNTKNPGLLVSSNIKPILAVENHNSPIIRQQENKNKSEAAPFISKTKCMNDFSSSTNSVFTPPNLSSKASTPEKVPINKISFSSPLNIVSKNNYPPPPDNSNQGLVLTKPSVYFVASPESLHSKTTSQGKTENPNIFYNNLQYVPNTIMSPNFLPLPNLKPTVTSEYFNNFYPYILQDNTYFAHETEGSTPQLYPLPNNFVYSPVAAAPSSIPPKLSPIATIETSKWNNIEPMLSVSPRINLSIPNNMSPLPIHTSTSNVPSLEITTLSRSPSHTSDFKSSANKYPGTNKESVLANVTPFLPKAIPNQSVTINEIPNSNSMTSPLNIAPGASLNIDITTNTCTSPVKSKITVRSEPENIITSSVKYRLPTYVPQPSAEEFSPPSLPSPNLIPLLFLPRVFDTFSSKSNTVIPPKMPNSSIPYSPVQSSPNSEMVSTLIFPFTNPCANTIKCVYPPSSDPVSSVDFIPNNIFISPSGKCTSINNVASLNPTKYETFCTLSDNPSTVPATMAFSNPEVKCPLSEISLSRINDISSFSPVLPPTSFIVPVTPKSFDPHNYSDVDNKLTSMLNSPSTYSSPPIAMVKSAVPLTSFNYSNTISPKISTQSTDKMISSINEIASSLTKDILSTILAKSLSSKVESSKTRASTADIPLVNPFLSKVTEFEPPLSKDLSLITNKDLLSCLVSKQPALTSPPASVESTQLNDYNKYLATSLLPDIIKALQLIINTPVSPKKPEPSNQLTPYISSLIINIVPPPEASSPDTHIILPSYVPTEYTSPISPTYFTKPTISSYLPTLPPIVLETPAVKTNSFNNDSRDAKRLLELILLSELVNGDENCDWDVMENIMALLCAS